MSENPFTDGQQFSAARLNSMYNAHQNNGVLSGLSASTSVNAFDVDISSGEAVLNGGVLTPASATVSHATSDPEDRIDLITVDATETISVTQGNPAATSGQPIAPDIPTDELLLALVYVRGGSSEILTGDIFNDYKVILQDTIPELISPQGEGSGIDADLVRGNTPVETVNNRRGDVTITSTAQAETRSVFSGGDPNSITIDNLTPIAFRERMRSNSSQDKTLTYTIFYTDGTTFSDSVTISSDTSFTNTFKLTDFESLKIPVKPISSVDVDFGSGSGTSSGLDFALIGSQTE